MKMGGETTTTTAVGGEEIATTVIGGEDKTMIIDCGLSDIDGRNIDAFC